MTTKYAYIGFILLMIVTVIPVSADNVTYPQDYYDLAIKAGEANNHGKGWYDSTAAFAVDSVFYELRRQTILMEKQNELFAEQNRIAWINTCYAPHSAISYYGSDWTGNLPKLKLECMNAGYPTRSV